MDAMIWVPTLFASLSPSAIIDECTSMLWEHELGASVRANEMVSEIVESEGTNPERSGTRCGGANSWKTLATLETVAVGPSSRLELTESEG